MTGAVPAYDVKTVDTTGAGDAFLGAVLTLLAVSNCTHKESYIDICITTCIIPLVSSLGLALIWGLFL